MHRLPVLWLILGWIVLIPTRGFAQISCTRAGLQAAVDTYIAAQKKGDPSSLPRPTGLAYVENLQRASIDTGILKLPLKIDFHRSLLDVTTCQTFTEQIITDKTHPYVIGTRLRVNGDKIAEIESIVTDEDDWLFNAENYLRYSSAEDWSPIPAPQRDSRATLIAAANAYLDAFLEGKTDRVPWGLPCNRTEGGMRTGRGQPDDDCKVGVPSGVNIVNRRFIADEETGAVVVFNTFGQNGLPDTHLFRVEKGKLRFVHTLTVCTTPGCGFQQRGRGQQGQPGRGQR